MTLLVAPCSHEAAKYAVVHWHYSRKMPVGKLIKFGAWEDERFIGTVLYGHGATQNLVNPYGLDLVEGCELVRVALTDHVAPVSRIVSATIRQVKDNQPGLRLIVSYADPAQDHHGGIYQAMNWIYAGRSKRGRELMVDGVFMHRRSVFALYGSSALATVRQRTGKRVEWSAVLWKHTYLYPLDKAMRRRIQRLALPYPQAVEGSMVSQDASGVQGQVQPLPTALNP